MIQRRKQEKTVMLGIAMRSHLVLLAPLMKADARPPTAGEANVLHGLLKTAGSLGLSLPTIWEQLAGRDLVDFIAAFFCATAPFLVAGNLQEARVASLSVLQLAKSR